MLDGSVLIWVRLVHSQQSAVKVAIASNARKLSVVPKKRSRKSYDQILHERVVALSDRVREDDKKTRGSRQTQIRTLSA